MKRGSGISGKGKEENRMEAVMERGKDGGRVCVRVCRNERSYGLNEGW